jgi:hypothetical protein
MVELCCLTSYDVPCRVVCTTVVLFLACCPQLWVKVREGECYGGGVGLMREEIRGSGGG